MGIYRGVNSSFMGISLSSLVETSAVSVSDLPSSVQDQLKQGIRVSNEQAGRETLNAYRAQIDSEKSAAASVADDAKSEGTPGEAVSASGADAGKGPAATNDGAAPQSSENNQSSQEAGE